MAACPGCGVDLPGPVERADGRSLASVACRSVYGEVAGYELEHVVELGRWHQLLVDTYNLQHVGPETSALAVAFALIGLQLALEDGWDGPRVRDAHQRLANRREAWPRFEAPSSRGTLTIVDLALAGGPADHIGRLRSWAAEVWQAWSSSHGAVRRLVADRVTASKRAAS